MNAWRKNLFLLTASVVVSLGLAELALRLAVQPSNRSWGRLAGHELPPLRLLPDLPGSDTDRSAPYGELVVDGRPITRGDLWGLVREDEELGYVSLESATSLNGWWQSNSLGARARMETSKDRAEPRRLIVFGESYSAGSRVRQEESWPHQLGLRVTGLEVVNFAVDGYSMAQSFLRYRRIRDQVDHDIVVIGFVPREDLVRDLNTFQALLGWASSTTVPRFRLDGDDLVLVGHPYDNADQLRRAVAEGDRGLENHLRLYDRVYFPQRYAVPPVVGRLVLYKLPAGVWHSRQYRRFVARLMEPGSEAIATVRAILETMASEVIHRGQQFVLVYIPVHRDVEEYRESVAFRQQWNEIVSHCPRGATCLDLMRDLLEAETLDEGYDGTHYGPEANEAIAGAILDGLRGRLLELTP